MNRYPLWKNLLIGLTLLIGLLYTLPNFFGEAPAIQVSPAKSTQKVDADLMNRVEQALKEAKIATDGVFLDATSLKVRFEDIDTQLKGKEVVQSRLGEDYVVALNLLSRSPRWLTAIGALPMYLGLDLRGGVHFLLQVDMQAATTKRLESLAGDLRSQLRERDIRHGGISREGQTLRVRCRDPAARDKAREVIASNLP